MKEHSLFRQPRKLATVTFLTAFYVAQVYVSTWYFSYVCDAVMDSTNLPSKMIRMVVIYFAMQGCLLVVKYGYDAACIRIRESMLAGLRRTLLESVIGQMEIRQYEQIGGSRIAGVLTNDVKALGKQVLVPQMETVKALLRLAAQGKSILLLDEPFAGIPQGCAAEIKKGFLRDDRVSMIWISHDEAEGPTGENMDCKLGNFVL